MRKKSLTAHYDCETICRLSGVSVWVTGAAIRIRSCRIYLDRYRLSKIQTGSISVGDTCFSESCFSTDNLSKRYSMEKYIYTEIRCRYHPPFCPHPQTTQFGERNYAESKCRYGVEVAKPSVVGAIVRGLTVVLSF
jgi:hypothetical protein